MTYITHIFSKFATPPTHPLTPHNFFISIDSCMPRSRDTESSYDKRDRAAEVEAALIAHADNRPFQVASLPPRTELLKGHEVPPFAETAKPSNGHLRFRVPIRSSQAGRR